MSIQSPYYIMLTPDAGEDIIVCAPGDWLEALPEFSASQGLFEADGVRLASAFFRPLGQVAVTLTFTLEEDHPDLLTALDAYLSAGEGGLLQASCLLTIFSESAYFEFPDAVVKTVTPDLPSGAAATLTRAFTILTSIPNTIISPP